MTRLSLTAVVALALYTTAATAAPHGGSAFIHDYDTDGDGQVTRAEFDTVRDQRYRATDIDSDGSVDEVEYVAEYAGRLELQLARSGRDAEKKDEERLRQLRQARVRFHALDRNKDGRIDRAEYNASGAAAFERQDDDKDGTVTQADAAATRAKRERRPQQ